MHTLIHYEQPLNERMRVFLRLDQLLARYQHNQNGTQHWDFHQALLTLLDIYSLTAKGDLKSEIIKVLESQISNLKLLLDHVNVDQEHLHKVLEQHRAQATQLRAMPDSPGQHLKDNDFINGLRQRSSIPGGNCDFDLPLYHHWLNLPETAIKQQLTEWIQPYHLLGDAIHRILLVLRENRTSLQEQAINGYYQQPLDTRKPYQMICVCIPRQSNYYPEISAGKHRFSVRFMCNTNLNYRSAPLNENKPIDLVLYAL